MEFHSISRRDLGKLGLGALTLAATAAMGVKKSQAASFEADELIYMSASELLPLFRARRVSPVEVLEAQIARFKAVGEAVNCVTYTHFDTAMVQAKESEQRYINGTARPLEGITVGVKDEHHDSGWIVTHGSILDKDNRQGFADPIVSKLKAAGAVLPIQTTVPEFYLNAVTWTKLWGVSRCPWNLKYAVGGSSGGSGGSLASGFCTLATGSDMGGSIRLPCAYNGLYGFKPPFGRVSTELPMSYFAGSGPMARTFEDMVRMQNVISGPSTYSPSTLPEMKLSLSYPGIKGMRIAYSPSLGLASLGADTKAGMAKAIAVLRAQGAIVEEVEIDPGYKIEETTELFSKGALGGGMGGWLAGMADRINDMTSYAALFVNKAVSGEYDNKALYEYENFIKNFHAHIVDAVYAKGYSALIMPTLITSHVPADYDLTKGGFMLEGQELYRSFIFAMTVPWNFLNWYPVVSVPAGLTNQGMPVGMQIIGNSYDDRTVLQIAHAYGAGAQPLFSENRLPDFREA